MSWCIDRIEAEQGVVMLACPALCWDNFPTLAEQLLQAWELSLIEKEWGADSHSWLLEFEGSQLRLEYEHHSGCWLEAMHSGDREVVLWLGRQHKG